MPNEAPTAETADVDFAALLRSEQAGLQAQLKELGFADQGSGLNYDSNFADSSQVTAERGEAERLATELREALDEVEAALAAPRRRDLRHLRGVREAHRRGPPRGHAGRPPLHRRRRQALSACRPEPPPGGARWISGPSAPCGSWPASVLVVALVAHHNITQQEIILFCVDRARRSSSTRSPTAGWPRRSGTTPRSAPAGLTLNPVVARRPGRHADRARPAGAERGRRLRLGQAGAGQRRPTCAARATRASWCRWPGRSPTPCWPRCSASSSSTSSARAHARRLTGAVVDGGPGHLLRQPGQRRAVRVQHDPGPAARRLGALRAPAAARWWPTYLRYRQYTMPILIGLVVLNFFFISTAHGPHHVAASTSSTAGGPASSASEPARGSVRQRPRAGAPSASAARAYVAAATSCACGRTACAARARRRPGRPRARRAARGPGRSSSPSAAATSLLRSP